MDTSAWRGRGTAGLCAPGPPAHHAGLPKCRPRGLQHVAWGPGRGPPHGPPAGLHEDRCGAAGGGGRHGCGPAAGGVPHHSGRGPGRCHPGAGHRQLAHRRGAAAQGRGDAGHGAAAAADRSAGPGGPGAAPALRGPALCPGPIRHPRRGLLRQQPPGHQGDCGAAALRGPGAAGGPGRPGRAQEGHGPGQPPGKRGHPLARGPLPEGGPVGPGPGPGGGHGAHQCTGPRGRAAPEWARGPAAALRTLLCTPHPAAKPGGQPGRGCADGAGCRVAGPCTGLPRGHRHRRPLSAPGPPERPLAVLIRAMCGTRTVRNKTYLKSQTLHVIQDI
eukprot:comp22803_c1_seq1/m.35778 comp22803_c1_seq1/g.35778  ORF comp22803_c1_seq1/g.35778 comp22803_c1_seq1/m.35778 type:complete len:331 (-) comp22803_c1_seq1:102-1094(-)